jgi:peptide/nickel transport system permease protein
MTLTVKPDEISFARPLPERLRDSWHSLIGALKRDPVLAASVFVLLLGLFLVAFSTFLTRTDYTRVDPFFRLNAPSAEHWFGTDDTGRDVFDRVLVGTRISFLVGFMVTALSAIAGTTIGMVAGYSRILDNIIMRLVDALLAFPTILLALALIALWGPGILNVIIALTITGTASKVRLVRSQVLSLRESTYVEASRVAGASTARILYSHIMPNTLGIVIVLSTFTFASSILAEAGLSFLGVGVPPHIPSWGNIIANGQRHVQVAFWVSFFPGVFLTITVLAVVLIGDALRDHLDPKLRGRLESTRGSSDE